MSESVLFVGGKIFTGRRYCEALLIEDGKVVVAGTEGEARRRTPTGAARRDLGGDLLVPGLIDAHFHIADATRAREGLDLSSAVSIEGLVEMVRGWAGDHPSRPVWGRGWDPERFPGREWPTRRDLDRAAPDRPTVVVHVSGHALIANSAALAAAEFDRSTTDPPGGRLGREADGTPDGRVFESAVRALESRIGAGGLPESAALRRTMQWTASLGITTLGAMSAEPEEAAALRELADAGALPGRVRVYLHAGRWKEYFRSFARPEEGSERFAVIGVKEYTDGAFGTRTAWLSGPYSDDPSTAGMPVAMDERLRELLGQLAEQGLAPALHAIGDRAIEYALGLLTAFPRSSGPPPRIEHAALTPPSLFASLRRVRPALVVQPGFLWSDHWLRARLGSDRVRWAYAFRSLQGQGLLLAGSSDAPYDPVDPWRGIRAAVERSDSEGRSANPTSEEALGPEQAIGLYTSNGGVVLGEPALGVLEPGSPADLLLVRASSLETAVGIGSPAVRETWVAGVCVAHGRERGDRQTV